MRSKRIFWVAFASVFINMLAPAPAIQDRLLLIVRFLGRRLLLGVQRLGLGTVGKVLDAQRLEAFEANRTLGVLDGRFPPWAGLPTLVLSEFKRCLTSSNERSPVSALSLLTRRPRSAGRRVGVHKRRGNKVLKRTFDVRFGRGRLARLKLPGHALARCSSAHCRSRSS